MAQLVERWTGDREDACLKLISGGVKCCVLEQDTLSAT